MEPQQTRARLVVGRGRRSTAGRGGRRQGMGVVEVKEGGEGEEGVLAVAVAA